MTKIHNAFSSEEWKERFENDFNYMRPSEGQKARGESGVLNPYDFEDIGKWFAAELEKKEKELNQYWLLTMNEAIAVDVAAARKEERAKTIAECIGMVEKEEAKLTEMLGEGEILIKAKRVKELLLTALSHE